MASKIIILSGLGRGIARFYQMTNKIRLEMDAVVKDESKRLAVTINGRTTTYPYGGKQIAIDLPPEKIDKASVVVYGGGKCLLSGASDGKCDVNAVMYAAAECDKDLINEDLSIPNPADSSSLSGEESSEAFGKTGAEAQEFTTGIENSDTLLDEANGNNDSDSIESAAKEESLFDTSEAVDAPDKGNDGFTLGEEESYSDDAGESDSAEESEKKDEIAEDNTAEPRKEHEVLTAMLESKSHIDAECEREGSEPFYAKVWHKIEEMFDIYPHDSALEELVYDSAWIRIPYEDDGYYVLGVISDEGVPVFICYGIPQDKMTRPDKEIEDSCEWLPLDKSDVSGKGYWLVYQDALTGENIS